MKYFPHPLGQIFLVILLLLIIPTSHPFDSCNYLELLSPGSEGFSQTFSVFNSYTFGLYSSPQTLEPTGNYSLGLSVLGTLGGPLLSVTGHFKFLEKPVFLGFSIHSSSSEFYNNNFEPLGNINQNFILFGIGSKFDKIFSFDFGEVDLGLSLLWSFGIWSFPKGVYPLDTYLLEGYGIPLVGVRLKTPHNLEVSVSQKFFIGGYYGDLSLGSETKAGIRYYPLSIFTQSRNIHKYLVLYPYLSYTYITSFPTNTSFVNEISSYRIGLGITSELADGLKLSLGVDNKGLSLSAVLNFFASPIGLGNTGYEGAKYELIPSIFLVLNEGIVKEILGITPDKEEVEKGIIEYEKGNFKNANYHFEKALRINPSNQVAQIYIQKLRLWLEEDEALTKEQQEYIKTLLTRAKVLRSQNRFGEALKEYKKVLELNPYNREAVEGSKEIESIVSVEVNRNYTEALNLYSKNELIEAKRVISKNFELNPFHEMSIKLAKEIDDRILAETSKKLDTEQRKSLSYSLYSQGMQEFALYNFPKALELFNKALDAYPDNKEAEEAIKRTLREIEAMSKVQESKAKSESLVAEGRKLKSEGKLWEAVEKFKEALKFHKENEVARSEITNTLETIKARSRSIEKEGDEFFLNGDISKAFEKWETAVSILGDLPDAVPLKHKIATKREELKSSIDIKIGSAEELLQSGDYVNAMKTIEGILKLDPTNKRAIDLYSRTKAKFDEWVDKKLTTGITLFNNKNYSASSSSFEELLNVLSTADPRYPRVKSYYEESEKKKKEAEVSKKLEEKLKEVDAFLANYDYAGAKKSLEEALALAPNDTQIRKKLEEVEKKAKEVVIRDEANRLLAESLRMIRKKEYLKGIATLKNVREKFLTLGDDVSSIDRYIRSAEEEFKLERDKSFNEGKIAYEKGEYIKAKELLEIALKNNPESQEIRSLLTEVNNKLKVLEKEILDKSDDFFTKGEYDKALEGYNSLLKISPNNELYRLKLDNVQRIKDGLAEISNLIRSENYSEALDKLENIIALNPGEKSLENLKVTISEKLYAKISVLRREVEEFIKNEDYRKALVRLRIILKSDPEDVDAKSKLSFVKAKLDERATKNFIAGRNAYNSGNYKEAIRLLSLVIEDTPENTLAKGLLEDAKVKYNESISRDRERIQKDIATLMTKGVEEYRKGSIDKAIEYWQKVLDLDPDNEQAKKYIARARLGR